MENLHNPDCSSCEAALCDYIDGALPVEARAWMETHLATCAACAEMEADMREAMVALQELGLPEAPPALLNRLLRQIPAKSERWTGFFGRMFAPVLQPRLVMGAMMTVLSLAMMARCGGVPVKSISAADLDPVKIWGAFDDRVHRGWDRTVKTYESMRLVYEVRSRVHDWRQQQEEQDQAAIDSAANEAVKNKQAPAKTSTTPDTTPGAMPNKPQSK